jgi:hypothetical protein
MANESVTASPDGTSLDEVVVRGTNTFRYYNIDKILSHNFLKGSRFSVQFPGLSRTIPNASYDIPSEELTFLCDSVEFPGQSLTSSEYRMPGKLKLKVPYLRDLNEVTLTFYHNTQLPIYNIFSTWLTGASPTSTQNRYFDDIVCNKIKIIQFADTQDETTNLIYALTGKPLLGQQEQKKYMTVELKNAFPLNFASMPGNWADEGFHKMSVSFFYEDLTISMGNINYQDIFRDLMKSGSIVDTPIRNTPNSLDFTVNNNKALNA